MRKVGRNFINKVEIKVELWDRAFLDSEICKIVRFGKRKFVK